MEIYLFNLKAASTDQLTDNEYRDTCPDWSPGGKIAFTSERDGNEEILL